MGRAKTEFTIDQIRELVELYTRGSGLTELHKKFGVSTATVSRLLKANGVTLRKRGRPSLKAAVAPVAESATVSPEAGSRPVFKF